MENNVTELDDFRPHFVIQVATGDVHVAPVSFLTDFIEGKNEPCEDGLIMIRAIVKEWLND